MSAFAVALHHEIRSAIANWEERQAAALAHHLAEMLNAAPREARGALLERISSPLAQFGVTARILSGDGPADVAIPRIPLTGGSVLVVSTEAAGSKLAAGLVPLYLGLTGGVLVALLIAIQGSIYWGLRRPLGAVERQIHRMRRGRWRAPAPPQSIAELARLGSGLEALGAELELEIGQWVNAERRAGIELACSRLRVACSEPSREARRYGDELLSAGELSRSSRLALSGLLKAVDELESQFTRPLSEIGLGPPEWDANSRCDLRGGAMPGGEGS